MSQMLITFSVRFDEGDVRRQCGVAAFARAAALQQAGHVLGPTVEGSSLIANVRGTWRRIERVTIGVQTGRLVPTCTCGVKGCCRHAGALLLQWLREPASFSSAPATEASQGSVSSAIQPDLNVQEPPWTAPAETQVAEMSRLLTDDTLSHLRQIARRLKLGVARNKGELIAGLAPALAEPSNVDRAIAGLGRDERLALDAAQLLTVGMAPHPETILEGFHALGGESASVAISTLLDLGLVIAGSRHGYGSVYAVPRSVASRLPPLANLARPVDEQKPARPGGGDNPGRTARGLGIEEWFQVIAHHLAGSEVRRRPVPRGHASVPTLSLDWHVADDDSGDATPEGSAFARQLARQRDVRLVLTPPLLADADLQRLSKLTEQPAAAIAFAAHLMAGLGLVDGADRLGLRADRLQAWHQLTPGNRLSALVRAWLAVTGWTELALVAGDAGPVHFRGDLTFYSPPPPLWIQVSRLRQLVANLIGRMAPDVWFDLASFGETIHQMMSISPLALPFGLAPGMRGPGRKIWWFADAKHPDSVLDLDSPEGWTKVYGALIGAFLSGPLTWLGIVDVAVGAFRVRPTAGILREREIPDHVLDQREPLVIGTDLTVTVPSGSPDASAHAMLARAGELVGTSALGLRYRLTAERVQGLFDAGMNGPELIHFLDNRSDGALPDTMRATLERWWKGYGALRLYDELTLIELDDDFLLPELLATSSLGNAVIHQFSPRLVAVDPVAVDALVDELTRLGHAPRVVENG